MNNFRYFPNSAGDIRKIYRFLGIKDRKQLFGKILGDMPLIDPKSLRSLPEEMDERELELFFAGIDAGLPDSTDFLVFAGAGFYRHLVPSAVDSIISRSEFYTPYTPYQPEVSQGTLFALFEFQSMIAEITGMEVVNASMYDGAESLAEAALMSMRLCGTPSGRPDHAGDSILVSGAVSPDYLSVLKSFVGGTGINIQYIAVDEKTGQTDPADLKDKIKGAGRVCSFIVQQPNFFGIIEDLESLRTAIDSSGSKPFFAVSSSEPFSFGLINPPGYYGADIFAGEGNSFGNYLNFGGPMLGLFGARKEYVRQMPGRIVGKAKDSKNRDAYAFILSTREQHIRRGAATSNICTNSSLNAVRAAVYLSLCSRKGFKEIALLNLNLAHVLKDKLISTGFFGSVYSGDFFNEFPVRILNDKRGIGVSGFIEKMAEAGILAGVKISDDNMLVAVTEAITPEEIERYIDCAVRILV